MNSKGDVCEICGRKDPKLGVIWYGQLDGLKPVWACEECRKVDEYVKGERGEREAKSGERVKRPEESEE